MTNQKALVWLLLGLGAPALVACRSDSRPHEGGAEAAATKPARAGMPEVDAPDGDFAGQVGERIEAGHYTYLRVARSSGNPEWVVTLGEGAPVGSDVKVVNMGVRRDFHSQRLSRTFDRLVFGIVRPQS